MREVGKTIDELSQFAERKLYSEVIQLSIKSDHTPDWYRAHGIPVRKWCRNIGKLLHEHKVGSGQIAYGDVQATVWISPSDSPPWSKDTRG